MVAVSFKMLRPKKEEFFFFFSAFLFSSYNLWVPLIYIPLLIKALAIVTALPGDAQSPVISRMDADVLAEVKRHIPTMKKPICWGNTPNDYFSFVFFFRRVFIFKGLFQKINIVPYWLCISNLLEALGLSEFVCFFTQTQELWTRESTRPARIPYSWIQLVFFPSFKMRSPGWNGAPLEREL